MSVTAGQTRTIKVGDTVRISKGYANLTQASDVGVVLATYALGGMVRVLLLRTRVEYWVSRSSLEHVDV